MSRWISAVAASLLLLFAAAVPVLAKDDAIARFSPPIPLDAEPGSTIEAEFDAFSVVEGGQDIPWSTPMAVLLVPADPTAEPARFVASEQPANSGHYVVTMTVPPSGIAEVGVGIRGETCVAGTCTIDDIPLTVTPDSVLAPAVLPPSAASQPPAANVPPITTAEPAMPPLPQPAVLLLGLGVVAAVAVFMRRPSREAGRV